MELSYILGNGNTEKIPYFSGKGFFLLHEEPKFLIFLQKKVKNKFFEKYFWRIVSIFSIN